MSIGLILLIIFLIPALLILIAGLIDWVLSLICIGNSCLGDLLHAALGGKTLPAWLWEQILYAGFTGGTPERPTILTIYWWVNMFTGIIKALADKITEVLAAVNIVIDSVVAQAIAIAIIALAIALAIYGLWRLIM